MRARLAILIALMAMVSSVTALGSPARSSTGPNLAQETDSEDDSGGNQEENGNQEEGGGSEEGEAAAETGPPWTYQMARIALVLLALTILGVAFAYYRFVATRRREGF
ncbi:MAG: hypothetical protein GEU68_08085 [Actinobacteria bacterium]|nr:hypothetical protein [Actinomycetota bacterium]